MDLNLPKSWIEKRVPLEGDSNISAGVASTVNDDPCEGCGAPAVTSDSEGTPLCQKCAYTCKPRQ